GRRCRGGCGSWCITPAKGQGHRIRTFVPSPSESCPHALVPCWSAEIPQGSAPASRPLDERAYTPSVRRKGAPMFTRLDHVGLVAPTIEEAVAILGDALGLKVDEPRSKWPEGSYFPPEQTYNYFFNVGEGETQVEVLI